MNVLVLIEHKYQTNTDQAMFTNGLKVSQLSIKIAI